MALPEEHPADRHSGHLVETHQGRGYNPRIVFFHFAIGGLLLILIGGLAYRQLCNRSAYDASERRQNWRRLVVPGPRGDIYDRDGRLLVGNRPRFAVVLYLDELETEFRHEFIRIRKNYRATGDQDLPDADELETIARIDVVQQYLDQVDAILGRQEKVDAADLRRHFQSQLLLPYPLLHDLGPEEFAQLVEKLPVRSPLQVYASSTRVYPHGSAAAHVLGFVGVDEDVDAEDAPDEDLKTFKMKGSIGRDGLEKRFDTELQGRAGGSTFRVDPGGFKINPPIATRLPLQGKSLSTSLDLDLQLTAEQAIGNDRVGAAVALDVRTGEVLALASKPDYDLNQFSPRLSSAAAADIQQRGAWTNLAIGQGESGLFPPGSTFKTLVAIAGLQAGISPTAFTTDCEGGMKIGNRIFRCDNGEGHHGVLALSQAIAESCDIYFWTFGLQTGPDAIAAEARRFHLDRPTGIELPGEARHMIIPDRAWKQATQKQPWTDGDTANLAIGQGYVLVTPLQMACYAASLARGETTTVPTLLHDPSHPTQHTEPIGLTPEQRAALLAGMEGCTQAGGTASFLTTLSSLEIPGVRIAGKTGTAQYGNKLDVAWFICFAPLEHPEIAVAVALEGDTPGETYGGGREAAPVADAILKEYFLKKSGGIRSSLTAGP